MNELLQYIIAALATAVTGGGMLFVYKVAVPWLRGQMAALAESQKQNELMILITVCKMGVKLMEQVGGGLAGAEKKSRAVEWVQQYLASVGLDVDVTIISDAIESVLREAKNELKSIADEHYSFLVNRNMELQREINAMRPTYEIGKRMMESGQ